MPRGRRRRNLDGSLPLSLLRACISFNLIMAPLDFEVPRRNGTELVICLLVKSGSPRSINLLASRASGRGEIGGGEKQGDGRRVAYNFTVKIINYLSRLVSRE